MRNSSSSIAYSAGFSVVFSIDPSSTGRAVLLGGDGSYGPGTRYDISGPVTHLEGGLSTIHLKVTAPGMIWVDAKIPACGMKRGFGKWMDEVVLTVPLAISAN
ncbi:MAG TPA: hypothetical protein VM658_16890 [bacterium]|nr:hypothetical protein [bacterium]